MIVVKDLDKKAEDLWNELCAEYRGAQPLKSTDNLYASEWSWNPMSDGNIVCLHEKYPYTAVVDGIVFYATGTNWRAYAIWDLCSSKEQCEKLTKRKNSCGYSWDILWDRKCAEYGLRNGVMSGSEIWKLSA